MEYYCKTPVAFIFFNRPREMTEVIKQIKKVKPPKIYLISDGARNTEEKNLVEKCRKIAEETLCSDCEVVKVYSEYNMGCRERVYTGITYALAQEEKIIILEDDVVPSVSFFKFMDCMLELYKNDEKVMMVSGYNMLSDKYAYEFDFYLSKYPSIWGWGTWKNAWNKMDINMLGWKKGEGAILQSQLTAKVYSICAEQYNAVAYEKYDTWDYQWRYARQINNGIGVVPAKSLIQNIGFGPNATHTRKRSKIYEKRAKSLEFPLKGEKQLEVNYEYDKLYEREIYEKNFYIRRIKACIKKFIKG